MVKKALFSLLALVVGCGGSAARQGGAAAPSAPEGSLEAQARSIVGTVATIRGLSPKQPVEIRALDEREFVAAFEDRLRRMDTDNAHPLVGSAVKARADLYLGFYDEGLKIIFVRSKMPKWAAEHANVRALLAHEITHALQDQHFGLTRLSQLKEPDQRLAFSALIEGDAELVSIAFAAAEKKRSWRRAILRDAQSDALGADTMIRIGAFSPDLMKSPPAAREMTTFPYVSGRAFAGALFRAGGFPLLDKAFQHPPETSEQVLHPQKYVDGERAVPVRDPSVPPGFTIASTLTFGELLTFAVLERNYPRDQARLLASGWGGDRVALIRTPAGAEGVLWASAWDSAEAAARFEEAVRNAGEGPRAGAPELVVREGTRVVMVAGVPKPLQVGLVKDLLTLPQAAPPNQPPIGRVAIPDPATPLENRAELRGNVRNGAYHSAALAVRSEVPTGFAFSTDRPSLQLLVLRKDPSPATGGFAFSSDPLDSGDEDAVHKTAVEAFVSSMQGRPRPRPVSKNALHTPLGKGTEQTWFLDKNALYFRTVLVPTCDRLGSFIFTMVWVEEGGRRALDAWLGSFRDEGTSTSPMCTQLKRESAE